MFCFVLELRAMHILHLHSDSGIQAYNLIIENEMEII